LIQYIFTFIKAWGSTSPSYVDQIKLKKFFLISGCLRKIGSRGSKKDDLFESDFDRLLIASSFRKEQKENKKGGIHV